MIIDVSGGAKENGIVVGNTYNKYASKNPIVKWIMRGFRNSLSELVAKCGAHTINEIGCGEGFWVIQWSKQGINVRGCDFSAHVIQIARKNAIEHSLSTSIFNVKSIYDLEPSGDSADLIVCCEVLEHLENPEEALKALQKIVQKHLIISVPREPLWSALNLLRGKYIFRLGNTEGHIQNWSKRGFISLVSKYFEVVETRSPLPWTMLLCKPRKD